MASVDAPQIVTDDEWTTVRQTEELLGIPYETARRFGLAPRLQGVACPLRGRHVIEFRDAFKAAAKQMKQIKQ